MAINFPDSPAENDSFTSGGKKWIFNGTVWTLVTANSYTIPTGEVTTAKILDANVTAAKLASGAAVANIGYTPANIASPTFTGTVVLPSTTSIGTVSNTEIGYVDGVTSAIQTQIDSKLTATTAVTSNRNVVINGSMDIWQRGTPFTTDAGATTIYTADRWAARAHYPGFSATQTITRESTHVPTGFIYSLKSVLSTAVPQNNQRMQIYYTMENADALKYAGKTMVVSFQAKAIGNIDTVYARAKYSTSGGTIVDGTTITTVTPTINTSSFTTCTFTFTVPSAATLTSTGTLGIFFVYTRNSGTEQVGDGMYLGAVQMEVGAVATPFEIENIGVTLAKCQRYYNRIASALYTTGRGVSGSGRNGLIYDFPVRMRASATVLGYKDGAGTASRATYHSGNFGNGANHGLTMNAVIASDSRCLFLSDSYSGFDFYIQDLELGAEL